MPSVTAKTVIQRRFGVFVSILIALMIAVGSVTSLSVAMGAEAMAGPMQEIAQRACQTEVPGVGTGPSCDTDETIPAHNSSCPMMQLCVNMASGAAHCAPLAQTEVCGFPSEPAGVAAAGYLRADIQASGLPVEPLFHPPIL